MAHNPEAWDEEKIAACADGRERCFVLFYEFIPRLWISSFRNDPSTPCSWSHRSCCSPRMTVKCWKPCAGFGWGSAAGTGKK